MLPTGEFEVMVIMCVMSPARKQKRLSETFTKGVGDELLSCRNILYRMTGGDDVRVECFLLLNSNA